MPLAGSIAQAQASYVAGSPVPPPLPHSLLVSYWTLAFVRVITIRAPVGILDDYERAGIRSNASPRASHYPDPLVLQPRQPLLFASWEQGLTGNENC